MSNEPELRRVAWLVFALVAVSNYGNFYVYDSIGPVADLLQRERGFTDTQIGMLNAIYSLPNVVLVLLGGILVDRFGASRLAVWTGALCLIGAVLTAFGPNFATMAAGRLLFGIGAETLNITALAAVAIYFAGANVAFSMGLMLAIGRAGSFSGDMSPAWFDDAYAQGWQPPLVIAAAIAASCFIGSLGYRWVDLRVRGRDAATAATHRPFVVADLWRFGKAYWFLLILCVLWYAVILAFRSTNTNNNKHHPHPHHHPTPPPHPNPHPPPQNRQNPPPKKTPPTPTKKKKKTNVV
jgi:MFS family permease